MDATILDAIPGVNPSGANLHHEAIYGEIRTRVRRARGEVIHDPDDPDFHGADVEWRFVIGACRDLLRRRSKDLMLAAWLTEGQLAADGLAGLRDGLDILRGLMEKFWETLYPEMEDGDFEARLRILEWLDSHLAAGVSPALAHDAETAKSDDPAARWQRNRELDACIDSLRELVNICLEKFGEECPGFAKLRDALQGQVSADSSLATLLGDARFLDELKLQHPADPELKKLLDLAEASSALADALPPPSAPPAAPLHGGIRSAGVGAISGGYFTAEEPGAAATSAQKVDFTLIAPSAVAAGFPFELFVWAHEPQKRWAVVERAVEELKARDVVARTKGPFRISTGTILSVRLTIPGAVIDEPEDTMVWEGESTCVSFVVTFPEFSRDAWHSGSAHIYANGVRVAKISFVLTAEGMRNAEGRRYRKAFASYASDDLDAVLGRIQGIHKVAPGLEVFLDVMSLRSGQNWEKELWRVIPASDIFYLFWSSHARKSEWVEKEWRCALRKRGIEFIDPIPLESPQESPPPPELSSLHFNDWELAFRRGKPSLDRH